MIRPELLQTEISNTKINSMTESKKQGSELILKLQILL